MDEREGIGKDARKIEGFRERRSNGSDAGRFIPSWDAGIAPQEGRVGLGCEAWAASASP